MKKYIPHLAVISSAIILVCVVYLKLDLDPKAPLVSKHTSQSLSTSTAQNISGVIKEKLPRLKGYSNKTIEDKVNTQLAELESSMSCFSGYSVDELREKLQFHIEDKPDQLEVFKKILQMSESELLKELNKYEYYDSQVRYEGFSNDILSINIHSSYFCGGAYPTNDDNQSITFDLRTGDIVSFENLFIDYEKNKKAILTLIYGEKENFNTENAQGCVAVPGLNDSQGDSFVSNLYFNYSLSGNNLLVQQELPHVIEACSEETIVPVSKLKQYINPNGILNRIIK